MRCAGRPGIRRLQTQRELAIADDQHLDRSLKRHPDGSGNPARQLTGYKNVVYFGVQLVLMAGLMLLTALVLLEVWQSANRPLPILLPLTISLQAQLVNTAVRSSAGLLRSAPSRAPPPRVRSGPNLDSVFREDPLIP